MIITKAKLLFTLCPDFSGEGEGKVKLHLGVSLFKWVINYRC